MSTRVVNSLCKKEGIKNAAKSGSDIGSSRNSKRVAFSLLFQFCRFTIASIRN